MSWLAFYNQVGVGDVLLLTSGPLERDHSQIEQYEDITVIKDKSSQKIVALNIFKASQYGVSGQGAIALTPSTLTAVNQLLSDKGIAVTIEQDKQPKLVVGHVISCEDHADSDHLHVTQIEVGQAQPVQIVCGAQNIAAGQHVLVALPGAVMPSGAIIWPGELRGVASGGMVCSRRELGLEQAEDQPGIWVLDPQLEVGTSLAEVLDFYHV